MCRGQIGAIVARGGVAGYISFNGPTEGIK